jgi:hypothetical protein
MTDAEILVARLRVASARLRLLTADVDEVRAMLSAGRLTAAGALEWCRQGDLLCLLLTDVEMDNGSAT